MLSDEKIKFLGLKANEIRRTVIETLVNAGSGHTAGSLGTADVFAYLFFHALNHDPKKPDWSERGKKFNWQFAKIWFAVPRSPPTRLFAGFGK